MFDSTYRRRDGATDFGCWLVAIVVAIVVLAATATALEAAGLEWYAPWRANKRTEVVRNTNQFVDTQVDKISGLVVQVNRDDISPAQRSVLIQEMCRAANEIDAVYVPEAAKPLMREEHCWNG